MYLVDERPSRAVDGFPSLPDSEQPTTIADVRTRSWAPSVTARMQPWMLAVLLLSGLLAGIGSVGLHLPVWTTEPVFSSINTAVTATMIPLGLYLVLRQGERFTGYAFALTGVTWSVNALDIYPGWGSYLGWVLSGLPYTTVGWGILRYRRPRLETRAERLFVPTALLLTCGSSAAIAPFVAPTDLGFGADARWPVSTVLSAEHRAVAMVLLVAGFVFLSLYFRSISVRWLRRAAPISRTALRPMVLFGSILAVGAASVQAAATLLPDLVTPHVALSLVGMLFLGVTGGLVASLTMQEMLGSRLLDRLPPIRTPQTISDYVSDVLVDPSAELLFWSPETRSLVDADGRRRVLPAEDRTPGRRYREWIRDGDGRPIALLSADADALTDPTAISSLVRILTLIAENAQLNALLRMRLAELTATRIAEQLAFSRAQEEFQRNLHDGLQQTLATVRLDLDGVDDATDDERAATVEALTAKITLALDQVRNLKQGARPPELRFGLKPAVERTVAELRLSASTDITEADLGVLTLPVYYLTRESLTNVHKHARADRVVIWIGTDGSTIDIMIDDDGIGGVQAQADDRSGGIPGMCARVAELGGDMQVTSSPGKGTTVKARIPCVSS